MCSACSREQDSQLGTNITTVIVHKTFGRRVQFPTSNPFMIDGTIYCGNLMIVDVYQCIISQQEQMSQTL